ncbi:hypothetical protein JCM3775_003594 [Rhodotorula graminis]
MPTLAGLNKVPQRLRPLATTPWDVKFLSNPTFASWLQGHLGADPPVNNELLVDYVRDRIPAHPSPYAPSAADLPPAPASITLSSSSSRSATPEAPAPVPQQPEPAMSFDTTFDDVLDMSSYAADEPSSLVDDNAFVDHSMAQFPAHSPVEPSFPHVRSANARTPSPFATYPGAVAPFSAPGTFYRHASPLPPNLGDPAVASSSLSATADLIHQGRAQLGGTQQPWSGYFASSSASSSSASGQTVAVQPGALFNPPLSADSSAPTMTITPSAISAPPVSRSASASRESTPKAAPAVAKKATASASTSSSSSSKVARSASPAVAVQKRPAPSTYSPEHWTSFLPKIRTYTDAKRLQRSPLAAAQFLVRNLHGLFTYADRSSTASPWGDASDVPPEGRAEVLSALASYAKDDFWRAWVEEGSATSASASAGKGKEKEKSGAVESGKSDGLELLQCWLEGASQRVVLSTKEKEAASAVKGAAAKERKAKELEHATLALVLKVLNKLPLSIDHLRAHSAVARRVKRIQTRSADSTVKAAASQLVDKWVAMQEAARAGSSATGSSSSTVKRKADEAPGPAKKAKTGTTPASSSSSSAKKVVAANPLPKAMPSFKKQPSGTSALKEALDKLKAANGPKPPPPPPPAPLPVGPSTGASSSSAATGTAAAVPRRVGKPTGKPGGTLGNGGVRVRKKVSWAEESELEKIKWIEKAVYGDEDGHEIATVTAEGESLDESLHLMQEQEGLSLAMHFEEDFEELIDWYEPVDVKLPDNPEFALLSEPKQSHELELHAAVEALSMDVDMPAESLAEPPASETDGVVEPDDKIKRIQLSDDMAHDPEVLQTIEVAQMSRAGEFASSDQISALLSQLTANGGVAGLDALGGIGGSATSGANPHAPPFGAGPPSGPQVQPPPGQIDAEALEALRSYPPEQVAALVQANPNMAAGPDLAALGIGPGASAHALGHGPVPPHLQQGQHAAYVPPGFGAAHSAYNGYVPPSAQHAPAAWGAPSATHSADPYNGYKPPSAPAPFAHRHAQSAMPPVSRRVNLRPKKGTPCKYFQMRKRCDWGDRCAFSHDL